MLVRILDDIPYEIERHQLIINSCCNRKMIYSKLISNVYKQMSYY